VGQAERMSNSENAARGINGGDQRQYGLQVGSSDLSKDQHPQEDALMAGEDLSSQWARVKARMSVELGEATYNSWVKPLELIGIGDGQVMVAAPTRFIRSWVVAHQSDRLLLLWQDEDPSVERVEVLVSADTRATGMEAPLPGDETASILSQKPKAPAATTPSTPTQRTTYDDATPDAMGAPLDERFTFENFVVGKSNELAHAAARRVAEATDVTFNPLFLYGGVGLGKTHLMHAIAWEIRRRHPDRKVLYLSAEKFMYQFVRALRFKDTMAFKQQFRTVDVLMIDDVQFISGKDSTQEEFFHTFNALIDHNHQVIISADRSPSDLEGIEGRAHV